MNPMSFDEALSVLRNQPELFKKMAEEDPDLLEIKWVESEPILHFCVVERYYDAVRLLASMGAKINTCKPKAGTPLHSAILGGDLEGVRLLLELGADPTLPNSYGVNPVEWCEFLDADDAIIALLQDSLRSRRRNR